MRFLALPGLVGESQVILESCASQLHPTGQRDLIICPDQEQKANFTFSYKNKPYFLLWQNPTSHRRGGALPGGRPKRFTTFLA